MYGPRLTNSLNIREAADYAVKTLDSWGLANVHEETWGPFGRGWSNELFEANEIAPRQFPLIAYPKAWTPGTNGPITADAVYREDRKGRGFAFYRGRLRGRFVMTSPMRVVEPQFEAPAHRFTDEELAELAQPRPTQPPPDKAALDRVRKQQEFNEKLLKFLTDEGARRWLEPAPHDGGTITVTERRTARSERPASYFRALPWTSKITGAFSERLRKIFRSRCKSTSSTSSTMRI